MNKTNKIFLLYLPNFMAVPHYLLEDAIRNGIQWVRETFQDAYDRDPIYDKEFNQFCIDRNICFQISIISGNRLIFDTTDELMGYFFQNIKNIPNEEIYDFLLSLVEDQTLFFDYNGKLINSEISSQCPREEYGWDAHIEFTEESCKDGKYKFTYNDRGIDTLYNSKWYKNE